MTPSELLYLFLDGEADASERTAVLSQLAVDPALQQEFQDAVKIRVAAQAAAHETVPPAALTARVFERAGFPSSLQRASQRSLRGASRLVPPVAAKMLVVAAFSAAAGAGITRYVLERNAAAPVLPVMASIAGAGATPESMRAIDDANVRAAAVAHTRHRDGPRIVPRFDERASATAAVNPIGAEEESPAPRVAREPVASIAPDRFTVLAAVSPPREWALPVVRLDSMASSPRFAIDVRGVATLGQFPARNSTIPTQGVLSNISLGVRYLLDPALSVGAAAGREDFPLFVQTSGADYLQQASLTWYGAALRYDLVTRPSLAPRPFAQLVLGGADVGPLARLTAAIAWSVAPSADILIGLEGTLLLRHDQQVWAGVQKVGASGGIAVSF